MSLLSGKRALIVGILNHHSIAYGIAASMQQAGAEVAFSYQDKSRKSRMAVLAKTLNASFYEPCDVTQDASIEALFDTLQKQWGTFDILVHSVAYAPSTALRGDYLENAERKDFQISHDTSSYSLTALAKQAKPLLRPRGALLTLTYLGAERVMPRYHVMGPAKASLEANIRYIAASLGPMGVRVNAISSGPVRTVAASSIQKFDELSILHNKNAPLFLKGIE